MTEVFVVGGRLQYYYDLVNSQILQYQSLTHGLFPLKIYDIELFEGHVRDNVYCAMCVWSLSLAYGHVDDDEGRTHELQQSTVKCMRGILFFYMRQAHKVELFKKDQRSINSLHCKFDIRTTDVSGSEDYHNLQIDVVSLYLLVLVQMISSGLYIIFTIDEVHFIQNLVYYVERTYRTADYGMWERGTRYNNGSRELHASAIGMAKAALEAINGFNLFGNKGTLSSVIYVDPDAHNRNNSILNSLLPRESNSKTTDAALLTITGFPAFAIDDELLRAKTKEILLEKLSGRFGLKRFHRDGYGTVLEDRSKQYYEKAELNHYEGIECEWPIFYLYLALEAIFSGDLTGGEYLTQLESLLAYTKHGKVIPKYYYVSKKDVELEREHPHEALRWPNNNVENTFLWGQSLLLITNMLAEKLVSVHEIDPIGRYSQLKYRHRNINQRYSSFRVNCSDLVVQVCLISENRNLQANLATYGIQTQTPKEIEPIVICPPHDLVRVYEELGKNNKLQLSGRPLRPLGSLGTSKIYKILGKTIVTYPIILDEKEFYMSLDMSLMIDDLKNCLAFVRKSWRMTGRPTVCFFLRDHNFRGLHCSEMVDFMAELKSGEVNGVKVKLGRLQTLVSTGCVEHLDYLKRKHCATINIITNEEDSNFLTPSGFESVYHPTINDVMETGDEKLSSEQSSAEIVQQINSTISLDSKMTLLHILLRREGPAFTINDSSVKDTIEAVYVKACYMRSWSAVRTGAALLEKSVVSLAPSITSMLVCGKQVSLGVFGQKEHVITEPPTPAAIKQIVYGMCMDYDPREVSLQQEMLIYLANIISTKPQLFKGMLKIRVGWIIEAMKKQLESCEENIYNSSQNHIYLLYPSEVKQLTTAVLAGHGKFRKCDDVRKWDVTPRNMLEKRRLEGALNRVPSGFYKKVWGILERIPGGLKVKHFTLPQQPILKEMTVDETGFKICVEEMLLEVTSPVNRQIIVELIVVVSTILSRNPELQIQSTVCLTHLVDSAIKLFLSDNPDQTNDDFFNLQRTEQGGSMTYLARSVVNNVLNDSLVLSHDNCSIS